MTHAVAPSASSRRAWIAVGGTTLGSVAVLLVWLLGTSTGDLREQLKVLQPWWLDACVLVGLIVGVYLFSTLEPGVFKREAVRLVSLAALGAALTLAVAPRTNRIFYDEQIYQSIGQNLADLRRAQVCHDGSVEYGRLQCASGDYNKQPYAYPHVLSLAYRLLGVHVWTAFAVNAARHGPDGLRCIPPGLRPLRRPRCRFVCRPADSAHTTAADVVGDGRGGAVCLSRARGGTAMRWILSADRDHRGAVRGCGRGRLCHSVQARVGRHLAGHRAHRLAAAAGRVESSSRAGGA